MRRCSRQKTLNIWWCPTERFKKFQSALPTYMGLFLFFSYSIFPCFTFLLPAHTALSPQTLCPCCSFVSDARSHGCGLSPSSALTPDPEAPLKPAARAHTPPRLVCHPPTHTFPPLPISRPGSVLRFSRGENQTIAPAAAGSCVGPCSPRRRPRRDRFSLSRLSPRSLRPGSSKQ